MTTMLRLPLIALDVGLEVLAFLADRYQLDRFNKRIIDIESKDLERLLNRW